MEMIRSSYGQCRFVFCVSRLQHQAENSLIQGLEQEEHDRKVTACEKIAFF